MGRFENAYIVQRPDGTMATVHAPSERIALKRLVKKEGLTVKKDGTSTYKVKVREGDPFVDYDVEVD